MLWEDRSWTKEGRLVHRCLQTQGLPQEMTCGCQHRACVRASLALVTTLLPCHPNPAQPGSSTPEVRLVTPKRHSLTQTQPTATNGFSCIPQHSLRSPKICLTQIFSGNLGTSNLKQAIISFTSDPGAWSLRAGPLIQGGGFLVLPAMGSNSGPTLLSFFPTSAPKTKIPHRV